MRPPFNSGGRHARTSAHVASCPECALAMRRERQYLERLREAPIPPASNDLTARLLERTSLLAAQPVPSTPSVTAPRTAARVLAMAAGGTVAAAGVLGVGALAAAGEPLPGNAAAPATLAQVSAHTPADGRALTADQLSSLRQEGWACPVLEAMGFRLESAKAVVRGGQPAVELRLSDGSHYATVTELHAGNMAASVEAVGRQGSPVQVLGTSPWSATYTSGGRTFTFESNLPADQADDAGPILERVGGVAAEGLTAGVDGNAQDAAGEPLENRLQRGINRIVAVFTQ
ncbi:anti-sigma factor [Pseudarthrobacter sp. SL88]|uniref:anti-sigma factor n=1 Tax=Pseudarthrobacter sp. SL88 TaxID=2994666 RepID=UPI002276B759|nr:anti-sigma factor [Pseudarthrobacter sp. SL88]MCY1674187.1 anti-sigma factor [Pseudarthrobacter sp. SL88]